MTLVVRPAERLDAPVILKFIRELADYERLLDQVTASEADVESLLFCAHPRAFCDLALWEHRPIGFSLWFYNLSSFLGRNGIYLEDIYVTPEHRGRGAGRAMIAQLARRCISENLGRLEWSVLDWNVPAQEFYDSLGASSHAEWVRRRLQGESLFRLAKG